MKFSEPKAEAGYLLAVAGRAGAEVGTRSEVGVGPTWQALVRVGRSKLLQIGTFDVAKQMKPGYEWLCWLIEDEDGHVIVHQTMDVDRKDFAEHAEQMRVEFKSATDYYYNSEPIDFGGFGG